MALQPPFDRVVFDCDSTLSCVEGVEELATSDELRAGIEELTNQAMTGKVPLDEVYGKRLELMAPRRLAVNQVGQRYIETAVPGAREVVSALHALDKEVRIVSGGLRLPVVSFGLWLGIRDELVDAVQVFFDHHGHYRDFERTSPLPRNGGKQEVLAGMPPMRTVFIGDGITDAEARVAVDGFVCFGGVAYREEVAAQADAVVDAADLTALLPVILSEDELAYLSRHPKHAPLLKRIPRT
jgi:phosphoserine phosphatase